MSKRNGINGLPDDPEIGGVYTNGDGHVYQWTIKGWKVIREPPDYPDNEFKTHGPR